MTLVDAKGIRRAGESEEWNFFAVPVADSDARNKGVVAEVDRKPEVQNAFFKALSDHSVAGRFSWGRTIYLQQHVTQPAHDFGVFFETHDSPQTVTVAPAARQELPIICDLSIPETTRGTGAPGL